MLTAGVGLGTGSALPGTFAINSTKNTNAASKKRTNHRTPMRRKRTYTLPALTRAGPSRPFLIGTRKVLDESESVEDQRAGGEGSRSAHTPHGRHMESHKV